MITTELSTLQSNSTASLATRVYFLSTGIVSACWAMTIPYLKQTHGFSDREVGLLLLTLGIGALVAMPLAGKLVSQIGCRAVLVTSSIFMCFMQLAVVNTNLTTSVFFLTFVLGMMIGATDCAMNIHGLLVEKRIGKPVMSGFHGCYSAGGLLGSLLLAIILSFGISLSVGTSMLLALLIMSILVVVKLTINNGSTGDPQGLIRPSKLIVWIGVVCFVIFLVEGTVLDWAAIFLNEYRSVDYQISGLGFACFSVAMTITRLLGDRLVIVWGEGLMILTGIVLAALSICLLVLINHWLVSLVVYTTLGVGCANVVPLMFSMLGRQNDMPKSQAVPIVTSIAYIGLLAGPAVIGELSFWAGLPAAFLFLVVLLLFATPIAYKTLASIDRR